MKADCLLPTPSVLAEGPVWLDNLLFWVDIERGEIHALNPQTRQHRSWSLPHRVGFITPTRLGDFILGTDSGLARFNPDNGAIRFIANPEADIPGNRFNDAKCDPTGRLWAGTMAIDETPERGALYQIDASLRIRRVLSRISISNGLAWSPDGQTLYYTDSPTRRVDAFDWDGATGEIHNRRPVVTLHDGFPDGMAIDHEGHLWIAVWGGACVACHDPATGRRLRQIDVSVRDVTSCCFGPDDALYITTSGRDVPPDQPPSHPPAGSIFVARPGIGGPIPPRFPG